MTTDHTPPADQTAVLTAAERQFLRFALDLAFDRMVSDDGFTDEDEAALARLRRMAAETVACRSFVSGGAVWCCEEGETTCSCVCHEPAVERQDGAQP